MTTLSTAPGEALCIGRFELALPAGWSVSGRSQHLYYTAASDAPAPPTAMAATGDPALPLLRLGLSSRAPLARRFELEGVGPAAWFGLGAVDSVDRRLVALAGTPAERVRLETMATAGREPAAEKGLRLIAAGYRPGLRRGFCLERGAFVLEPTSTERTELVAQTPALPGVKLSLDTHALSKPATEDPLAGAVAELQALGGQGSTVKVVLQAPRTVAGLAGTDWRAEFSVPGSPPRLVYRFHFPGLAKQAAAPAIMIALDLPLAQRAQGDAAWEQLLGSMQAVPAR